MRPALELQEIHRSLPLGHGTLEILKGVTFSIDHGELVALVGPSGNGKSTLLGIAAGLDSPSSGRVVIEGSDITDLPEHELADLRNRRIGMVFQSFNLVPTLTALENVEVPIYAGRSRERAAERAAEMLELVGLGHRLHHRPNQLSGGEQQRVAIARALVNRPALVIADEPTGNLDSANGQHIVDLLHELRRQTAATFLVATHDPRVAAEAGRELHLADGRLVDDIRR